MKKTVKSVLCAAALVSMVMLTACGSGQSVKKAIHTPEDFEGAEIAVQTATTASDSANAMIQSGMNFKLHEYEKVIEAFEDTKLGRCDAVYVDSVVAAYYTTGEAEFETTWFSEEGEPMGICLSKENTVLGDAVEKAVDTLYFNGTIASITQTHFGDSKLTEGIRTPSAAPVLPNEVPTIKPGVLMAGMEIGYPPMEYSENGIDAIGFDVDVARAIANLYGLELELVNTSFDGIFEGLTKGQYDIAISAISITPDRQEKYFLTEPYVSNRLSIVVPKKK